VPVGERLVEEVELKVGKEEDAKIEDINVGGRKE
jgi:hypothetical protein